MSQQEQPDAQMTFGGKKVSVWGGESEAPEHAATLPQRSDEMRQVFDRGEFKQPLTEATRNAVQSQQQQQGVERPIEEARLLGSGSFTGSGMRAGAENISLLQMQGFKQAVGTIGTSSDTACYDTNVDAEDTQNQPRGSLPMTAQDPSMNSDDNAHLRKNNIEPVNNPAGFENLSKASFVDMPGQEEHTQTAVAGGQPAMTLATTLPRLPTRISNKAEPATTDNFLETNNAQKLPTPQQHPTEQAAFDNHTMYDYRFRSQAESSAEAAARAPGERPPSKFNPRPGDQPSTPPRASSSTQPAAAPAAPTAEEQHKSHFKKVLGCIFCNSTAPAGGSDVELPARVGRGSGGRQAGGPSSGAPQAGAPAGRRH